MAAQAARLIGLVMLVLELHHRSAGNVEFYLLCGFLIVGLCEQTTFSPVREAHSVLAFVLAYTATNTGSTVPVQTLGLFLCSKAL